MFSCGSLIYSKRMPGSLSDLQEKFPDKKRDLLNFFQMSSFPGTINLRLFTLTNAKQFCSSRGYILLSWRNFFLEPFTKTRCGS